MRFRKIQIIYHRANTTNWNRTHRIPDSTFQVKGLITLSVYNSNFCLCVISRSSDRAFSVFRVPVETHYPRQTVLSRRHTNTERDLGRPGKLGKCHSLGKSDISGVGRSQVDGNYLLRGAFKTNCVFFLFFPPILLILFVSRSAKVSGSIHNNRRPVVVFGRPRKGSLVSVYFIGEVIPSLSTSHEWTV